MFKASVLAPGSKSKFFIIRYPIVEVAPPDEDPSKNAGQ
jgi:hypothetical protein